MWDPMGRLGMRILLRGWLLSSEDLVCLFVAFVFGMLLTFIVVWFVMEMFCVVVIG